MTFQRAHYFERIGYRGDTTPNFATLTAIVARHATHIPFENLDVRLHKIAPTSPDDVAAKLVDQHRGGFCFEQNTLMLTALRDLGYRAHILLGRIRWMQKTWKVAPPTHMLLYVHKVPDALGQPRDYLVDVGSGGRHATRPLVFEIDRVQTTPQADYRIVELTNIPPHEGQNAPAAGTHAIQTQLPDASWVPMYMFRLDPRHPADLEVSNWYVCTHPDSHFRHDITAAIATEDGGRWNLSNDTLTYRSRTEKTTRRITSVDEMMRVLHNQFGLRFTDADVPALRGIVADAIAPRD